MPSSIHHSVARAWLYTCVLSHASLSHINVTISGLLVVWAFEKRSSVTASSLKHGSSCSMVFQEPSCDCRSCDQRYVSCTLLKSWVQRLRCLNLLAVPHHVTGSQVPCFSTKIVFKFVPSKIVPSLAESEIAISNIDSLGCWVRSFLRLWRLSKDKDSGVILIPIPTLAVRVLTPHHHPLDERIWSCISSSGHRWPY